jgi:outer membrane receptor protein involved in Fe transport
MKRFLSIFIFLFSQHAFAQQNDNLPKKDSTAFNKTQLLNEFVVKSKKPFIEIQVDKMVMNVQNDIVASGGNVFEVLQRAPGVSVTNDEIINLAGKSGVNVLIDGRATQLGAKDLANYLKSTPASVIDKIEIIMNPSAKYDAQGNAGIINIRLKKNTIKGTNGSLSSTYIQSVHANINFSGNINYRKGKWNWFANASARKSRQNTDGAINRYVNSNNSEKTFENRTVDQDASKNIAFRFGADFFMNSKSTFGFMIKGNEYWSKVLTPGETLIKTNNTIDSSLNTLNNDLEGNSRFNYNINYKFQDTLGNEFNVDADYTSFKNNNNGRVTTDLLNNQHIKYGYTANDQQVLTDISIISIRTDLSKQLKKLNAKIETGVKWNTVQTSNDLVAFIWNMNQMQADTGRTNMFNYTETMYAGYVNFNQKIKKWEYQLGLRAEQTMINGKSTDLKNIQINYPDTAYFNLFPTAFVRYTMNDKNSLGLSYGRRISRPTYQDLNPFEYIYDNYSRERGNPYLLPEFSNNFELTYSYRGALNVGLGYSNTNNFFQSITTQSNEVTTATNYNVGDEHRYFMNFSLGMPVTKWWDSYTNLSPYYKQFNGVIPEGKIDNSAWGMNWYASQNFNLPKKWRVQISSWGNITTRDAMSKTLWLGSVDAGISKSVLKDKLNLRLSASDIFNTQRWRQETNFGNVNFNYNRKWESRSIRLQLTWKFGKTTFKARERELGTQDENDRIK